MQPALARVGDGVDRLVIAPDGPLHALPFELLVTAPPGAAAGGSWIARFDRAGYLCDPIAALREDLVDEVASIGDPVVGLMIGDPVVGLIEMRGVFALPG